MKVSVLTWTFRDSERLHALAQGLALQTYRDFEWVLVDDLYAERKGEFANYGFPVTHIAPREVDGFHAPEIAVNTGLLYVRGQLVFCCSDYVLPSPGALARHWQLYKDFGPRVLIGGQVVGYGMQERGTNTSLDRDLGEILDHDTLRTNAFLGRIDSFPIEAALEVNGLDEFRARAGSDVIFAMRLMQRGCRYLVDTRESGSVITTHRPMKPERQAHAIWQETFETARAHPTVSNCPINLREERRCTLLSQS